MSRPVAPVLGEMPVGEFLEKYWQKEPLVVRRAFPDLVDPLSPDDLAGLACDPGVDSRLVRERLGKRPWRVTQGPQRPKVLQRLPKSRWTLLIESVDRHSPGIAALASRFSFLPRWRMDDVMVSLAPNLGTVDAHIDSYDVFLIQGQGRRKWEVDRRATGDYRPGLDLRILKRFHAQESWTLEPGDMLYVPPGVGHRGVTVPSDAEIALTYSIGFRAPSTADLFSTLLSRALSNEAPRLFADKSRTAASDSSELSRADLSALRSYLIAEIESQSEDAWTMAMGETVTSGGGAQSGRRVSSGTVAGRLAKGAMVRPVPGARMTWAGLEHGRAALFINGEGRALSRSQAFAASVLCGEASPVSSRRLAANPTLVSLVAALLQAGVLDWAREKR